MLSKIVFEWIVLPFEPVPKFTPLPLLLKMVLPVMVPPEPPSRRMPLEALLAIVKPWMASCEPPSTTTPLPHAPVVESLHAPLGVPPFAWNPTIDPPAVKFAVPTLLPI